MSRRKAPEGICHLCGKYGKLSFEHVPPEAAFNDHTVREYRGLCALTEWASAGIQVRAKIQQGGCGAYTLCEKCNDDTGAWYGNAFLEWTFNAARVLNYTHNSPTLYYPFNFFPLRVIKQVISMFFSNCGEKFRIVHPDLEKFVLSKYEKFLDPEIKIFVFYTNSSMARSSGVSALAKKSGLSWLTHTVSELVFPPLGYLMTFDSQSPDTELQDISFFSNYGFNDWKQFSLKIPIKPISTPFPCDYRTSTEVLQQEIQNRLKLKQTDLMT